MATVYDPRRHLSVELYFQRRRHLDLLLDRADSQQHVHQGNDPPAGVAHPKLALSVMKQVPVWEKTYSISNKRHYFPIFPQISALLEPR
jgi:hypothetical protein